MIFMFCTCIVKSVTIILLKILCHGGGGSAQRVLGWKLAAIGWMRNRIGGALGWGRIYYLL